jgi:hypothetical protein
MEFGETKFARLKKLQEKVVLCGLGSLTEEEATEYFEISFELKDAIYEMKTAGVF